MQSSELLKLLQKTGAILNGHFLLTSGRHSDVYFEKFRIMENPTSLNKVCSEMANIVKSLNIELVLGAAIGGILISGGVGRHLGVKHIFSERVKEKMELRRGFSITKGERVVIVEDIITTGGSVVELFELAESHGDEIIHIVNLVDRSTYGVDFAVPSTALIKLPSESWEVEDCPLCEQGMTITQRGCSGKELEII